MLPAGAALPAPGLGNRTHWALAYLNKVGLITRVARGQYEVYRPRIVLANT